MKIFVNAGHWIGDQGVSFGSYKENALMMAIRDKLKELLPDAEYVPDSLDLKATIEYSNQRARPDDFAIDIHLNSNKDSSLRGTEAYYYDNPRYAEVFSRKVSEALGIPNRGPKPDTQTYVGSLGFLRKLKCPSVVIECAYLSNSEDRTIITREDGLYNAARGIKNALDELFPPKLTPIQKQSILNLVWAFINDAAIIQRVKNILGKIR